MQAEKERAAHVDSVNGTMQTDDSAKDIPSVPKVNGAGKANNWKSGLILNEDRKIRSIYANAATAFRNAPEWKGKLSYNEFSLNILVKNPPWPKKEQDPAEQAWVEQHDGPACE